MKTRQELYENAYRGLAAQNWAKAVTIDSDGAVQCVYQGTDGKKCSIGHNIPDDLYTKSIEGLDSHHPSVMDAAGYDVLMWHFADSLQLAHDEAISPEDMKLRFDNMVTRFGVTIPEVL